MKRVSNRTLLYVAISTFVISIFLFTHRDKEFLNLRFLSNKVSGSYPFDEKKTSPEKIAEADFDQRKLQAANTDAKTYFDNKINKATTKNNSAETTDFVQGSGSSSVVSRSGSGENNLTGVRSSSMLPPTARNSTNIINTVSHMSTTTNEVVNENISTVSGIQKVTAQPAEPGATSSPSSSLGSLALGDGTLMLLMLASVYFLKKRL